MRLSSRAWIGALLALALVPAGARAAGPAYKVAQRWQPGGDGFWDYLTVDPDAHRLYFGRGTRVQVLDTGTGKLAGEIPDTPGIHGVALAPDLGRGFTSNGRDSSVTIFDMKTLATIAKVRLDARNPDAILYDAVSKRVFTLNGGSDNATALDAATGTVIGNVALGGRPEFAVADGQGRIYVNLEDSSAVVSFDAKTLALGARWPLAPGEHPSGLAMDREHRRLFSVCSNEKMIVMNADDGKVVADVAIGKGPDAAAFDPEAKLALSSNGRDGNLTVVREESPEKFAVAATVETQRGARTMALDPKTHKIYLATASFGEPPAPTPDRPPPRPPMVPGSFVILVLER